jgi:hypothetical protein
MVYWKIVMNTVHWTTVRFLDALPYYVKLCVHMLLHDSPYSSR